MSRVQSVAGTNVSKLALIVTIQVTPGETAAVLQAVMAHAARSLNSEPGTLRFDVLVPFDEDNTIVLYEAYADGAAYQAHHNGASMTIAQKDIEGKVESMSAIRCAVQE